MEEGLLPKAKVAEVLDKYYVEARLHTDSPTATPKQLARILEKQKEFVGHPALPVYVIVDPVTGKSERKLQGGLQTVESLVRFLRNGRGN